MNVHVALAPTAEKFGPNDIKLISLCKRARRLFTLEKAAENKMFAAQDAKLPYTRQETRWKSAMERLTQIVGEVASTTAWTPEGLAYKASMLAPWLAAGFVLDDGLGSGRELAESIAADARRVGIDAHMDLRRLRTQTAKRSIARPPRSENGNPAHH